MIPGEPHRTPADARSSDDEAANAFTGERITPTGTPEALIRESHMRYLFASRHTRGQRVADVACGSGMGTGLLARLGASACLGLDMSFTAVAGAATRYPDCR